MTIPLRCAGTIPLGALVRDVLGSPVPARPDRPISYTKRTVAVDDGRPLHSEVGYLRSPRPGWIELVVAYPSRLVEVNERSLSDSSMRLCSSVVAGTGTAKDVTVIERDFDFEPGVVSYSLRPVSVA
jgi:hypothetical protein